MKLFKAMINERAPEPLPANVLFRFSNYPRGSSQGFYPQLCNSNQIFIPDFLYARWAILLNDPILVVTIIDALTSFPHSLTFENFKVLPEVVETWKFACL